MNSEIYFANYKSPIGIVNIESDGDTITSLSFAEEPIKDIKTNPKVVLECLEQLAQYFSGERQDFKIPVKMEGTLFQKKVWEEVLGIKYGKTMSYIDLAKRLGSASSVRAVGAANGRNRILLLIPCHRVLGADGKMVGYAGGTERKHWLLEHEGKFSGMPTLF